MCTCHEGLLTVIQTRVTGSHSHCAPCIFLSSECHGVCPKDLPRRSRPRGFLSQGWTSFGTRNLPRSPPLQLAALTDTGSQGLAGQLMEKAAGNLLCNKTVHKRQMSIKGSASAGNRFLCPCVSLRQAGTRPQGLCRGPCPTAESLEEVAVSRKPKGPPCSKV